MQMENGNGIIGLRRKIPRLRELVELNDKNGMGWKGKNPKAVKVERWNHELY